MNGQQMVEYGTCVRWKGTFGFIRPDVDGEPDVFCHYSALESEDGYRQLREGQRVTFARVTDRNGRECAGAVRISGGVQ